MYLMRDYNIPFPITFVSTQQVFEGHRQRATVQVPNLEAYSK